ncbi:cytochrome P450 [Aspergillus germanicus]
MSWTLLYGALAVALLSLGIRTLLSRKQPPLPPGPRGLPFLGSLLAIRSFLVKNEQHHLYRKWGHQYGELMRVKFGPSDAYYLNSPHAVKDVLDKNFAATSDRGRYIFSGELMTNGWQVLLLNASDPRRETLKSLHYLASNPSLAASAEGIWDEIERLTYRKSSTYAVGMDVARRGDPAIKYIMYTATKQILGTLPAYWVVDVFSWLSHLPGFLKPWEKHARGSRGLYPNSFLAKILKDDKLLGFPNEEEPAYLAMNLIHAAADTSWFTLWSFMEAMLTHPDVQRKAQEEIDKVVGDRLPAWEDLEHIPYIRYVMKENWRWRLPVGLGHSHASTKDLVYNGHLIPKGSRMYINAFAIHYDPARFPDPDVFRPERYEGDTAGSEQSRNSPDIDKRDHFVFGSGRRGFADRTVSVTMMRILWAFDIVLNEGAKLPINPTTYPGPLPGNTGPSLPFNLQLRSEKRKDLIEKFRVQAEKEWAPIEPLTAPEKQAR